MGENVPDIQLLNVEVNGGDDSVFVAANIKDVKRIYFIGGIEYRLEFRIICKRAGLNDFTPSLHWGVSRLMDGRKVSQCFVGYYSHTFSLSQFEIFATERCISWALEVNEDM
ncbi:hypothetical protein FHW67_002700 [Herbaspirillum sp. Sphag1AN]|nr:MULTISPECIES: hypothetical protein [unclassified Herbaspirillum]MBB3213408.1 hypothetical protein [Herbaspirillum sp. Sphag1AN]MBB3246548.1 hypothetical protein [Herbaspirillum sp. Sphag64]